MNGSAPGASQTIAGLRHFISPLSNKGKAERGRAPFGYLWGKGGDQKI
jgi:hypothetical protein